MEILQCIDCIVHLILSTRAGSFVVGDNRESAERGYIRSFRTDTVRLRAVGRVAVVAKEVIAAALRLFLNE